MVGGADLTAVRHAGARKRYIKRYIERYIKPGDEPAQPQSPAPAGAPRC